MHDPQYNAATSDTPDSLHKRHYPHHEHSLVLFTSSAGLHGDTSTGMQTSNNYWPSIESTTLPCMCHGECSQLTAHETVTQSHEPQCQYHAWGSATNLSFLRPFHKNSCASLDCTSPYLAPSAQPKLNSTAYQDQYDALTVAAAQMQSNSHHTFGPNGSQAYIMPTNFIDTPYTEYRDLTTRAASMPQSSHDVSTPNSVFSRPYQSQNFADGHGGIKTPDSTVDSKEIMQITEEAMLIPQLGSAEIYTTPKREVGSPYQDWLPHLSSSQGQTDASDIHIAQNQQQVIPLDSLSFDQSYIAPDLLMNKGVNNLSPGQIHSHYNNGMHQQNHTGMFAQTTTDGTFAFVRASDELNDHFYTGVSPFTSGVGHNSYSTQSHSLLEGFDFNDSPLYPANHYGMGNAHYDIPLPTNTLPSQNGNVQSAGKQLSKIRAGDRANLDEKLIKWRAEGMTYKEIMNMGNWGLEESTLRGRHRTLTKPKEERVRKPQWDNAALSALVAGVDHLAPPAASSRRTTEDLRKVPWKKVTEWMQREKGCYPYGYHTIKKKYQELLGSRQMQREVNQWRRANGEHPL